jgi:hypothetical protein
VHVSVVEPFVAVIVTESVVFAPVAPTVGVESDVTASELETPVSEVDATAGAAVAAIAVTVTAIVDEVERPSTSVTE